ncbi:AMP-binding protein [Mycolicibacterium mucogenicum]|uniref:NAD-dependent epimerase/dehydratase family protein n=1 Tax=Mycolicibacterium mucogenicum TaxID=56689 RepID=A0A4R5WQ47_MYCMU|nr:AMP-binding protein [Mycolicibacterium mucogenicum]TDK93748.1 NAD-dependent epimerase/dehydratase family protein [Mycolicibacterium mucogenicum]
MAASDDGRIPLSISQQNIYHGVLQDPDPALYLIGKSYRFRPLAPAAFLSALEAMVLDNPIQLCVLEPPVTGDGHPELVARLRFEDIACVPPGSTRDLPELWTDGILGTPLVRYVMHTDADGRVVGMDAQSHHILLDGAATAVIEAGLARHLDGPEQKAGAAAGLALVAAAHRSESGKVAESTARHVAAARRELTEEALRGTSMPGAAAATLGTAGRGVLRESSRVADRAYDEIVTLAENRQVPLNILVAAAATAVHASLRQSTEALLVHPVDNRFGAPELNVATCLVNSVAHPVRFAPFAAVRDVVTVLDRGYVKALRRRWFREERYRRMHLAITRGAPVEALTVNYLRGRSAAELSPYLSEAPVVTDIGPVEGMTVACVHDEAQRTIDFAIWTRDDQPDGQPGVVDRIVAALRAMDAHWDLPIALTVGEWSGLAADGRLEAGSGIPVQPPAGADAWFLDADLGQCRGPGVDQWIAEIICRGVDPGDVLVFVDDDSQRAIELLIACHLAGCGYSVCATPDDVAARVEAIAEQCATGTHAVELTAPLAELDSAARQLVDDRIGQVAQDRRLGSRLAYVMPTSGSTGQPKLVPVTHRSLAIFCAAARAAYGWGPADTILQCAPLTSDISVEEIFGALSCGTRVVRSAAMRAGDMPALTRDVAAHLATVLDLPTAVWHLLCEDDAALAALGGSALRQVVIGGEAVRPAAVDKWLDSAAVQGISMVSTYGPTETTVVVTHLPIGADEPARARARLGRPLVPGSVFVAFGEVVVVGELVSAGYIGLDNASFGTVQAPDGSRQRVFATGDRVTPDGGHPVLAGRRDAVVKIAGRRFDTAALLRKLAAAPEISDVAVEPAGNGLGIWFQSALTRTGHDDPAARARVRSLARGQGTPAFSVFGVPGIPRQPNGKVDRAKLTADIEVPCDEADQDPRAAALAELWSRMLERPIGPSASLLDEGIGSLDLIRILPETRRFLDWQLSILDLIGADSAANVVGRRPDVDTWMDDETAAQIADDLAAVGRPAAPAARERSRGGSAQTVVILGASGILGTGFAQAILDRRHAGLDCPDVVFAARSPLPEHNPWSGAQSVDGVDVVRIPDHLTAAELGALLDSVGARTVVNCIGNTNVLVPYHRLRAANVSAVASIADACARRGAGLVQLSTFVVNADVTAPRVTDPRHAPYPYAASKALAEIAVSRAAGGLDFSVVRLPRVLGDARQLAQSSDILVAMVDACTTLRMCPVVPVTEEVTTGVAAAHSILGLLPQLSPAVELGRGMAVLRGEKVSYTAFLGSLGFEAIALAEWKDRLDRSGWAARNPQRWAVLDAWVGLGARLRGRTYADYLAEYPSVDVDFAAVAECTSAPEPLRGVFGADQIVRKWH